MLAMDGARRKRAREYGTADQQILRADERAADRRDSRRRSVAVRTEVGRLPLPGVPRRRADQSAIQERPIAHAVLPGGCRDASLAEGEAVRARWRDRDPARRRAFI